MCKIGSPLLSFLLCSLCTPLQITDKVHWMSLSKPASCWAEKGLELLNQVSERDTALEIKEAGYDIEFTAKRLKDIYES